MTDKPLMPKATAVWLVDNTTLTFDQIAAFCGLHPLEVQGIADGDVAHGIKGRDPVANGELTSEMIAEAEKNAEVKLKMAKRSVVVPQPKRKGPRYTPLSKRQERPDAIMWLVRYHPEISDAQISKLVGTTKPTIQSIRERTHWNISNIKPVDPVTLGLCTQIELDEVVRKAAAKAGTSGAPADTGPTILPADETTAAAPEGAPALQEERTAGLDPDHADTNAPEKAEEEFDPQKVFATFGTPEPADQQDETDTPAREREEADGTQENR